ncbi:MAG: hypothetical protein IKX54_04810 [Lachnospiraceae bacterium]|nr:hypothetical protein [Lachnospiraceae bacterium]
MKKKLMLLLALVLCVCLAACGDDDDDNRKKKKKADTENEDVTPTPDEDEVTPTPAEEQLEISATETWGDYTVGIPTGWTFRKGDALDEDDTRYCSVKKSDFKFFDFKMEDESLATQHYNYNKETYTNEQENITGTYAGIVWTGFQYSDGWGGYGFELISIVNGKYVRVSSCGFKFDSAESKLVLGSLVIK